jgi:hypothetical protein
MFKTFGIFFACVAGLITAGVALNFLSIGLFPVKNFNNKVELNRSVLDAAWNPERCMSEYDWFLQREESLKARVTQLENFQNRIAEIKADQKRKEDAKIDTWQIDEELKQVRIQATGLNNFYETEKAEYIAKTNNIIKVHCKDLQTRIYVAPSFVF